jgi:mono/diheme cytochrome c family protein
MIRSLGVVAILVCAVPSRSAALESVERGRTLVETACATCHAIDTVGESPLPSAPRFRDLGRRYPVSALEEALAEGIVTAHRGMPEFTFEPEDVGAIIKYLESIQAQ